MEKTRSEKISETMRKKHAQKYGLEWLPASRGTSIENKFVSSWDDMKRRCNGNNKNKQEYKDYFLRGIKVYKRWETFACFFIDMWDSYLKHLEKYGKDGKNTSLDRIDNNKGYSLKNCRWATRKEQQYNRTNTIKIKGKTLHEWSKELGIERKLLYHRYYTGLTTKEILSNKKLKGGRKKQTVHLFSQ